MSYTYGTWLEAVDDILLDRASLTSFDLEIDYSFSWAYEIGKSPTQAAIEALFDVEIELLR